QYMVMGVVVMALLLPLLMAYWFAPALVLFDGLPAKQAMKLSFAACLRNVLPFTLYGVVGLVLFVLGSIPLGLGLLAVIPVLFATSIYTAYRDIFVAVSEEN
ncbi:MAG: BPSS1780 family membrane protein, partial [Sulfuricella sp.]